jgi:hypothetical protein
LTNHIQSHTQNSSNHRASIATDEHPTRLRHEFRATMRIDELVHIHCAPDSNLERLDAYSHVSYDGIATPGGYSCPTNGFHGHWYLCTQSAYFFKHSGWEFFEMTWCVKYDDASVYYNMYNRCRLHGSRGFARVAEGDNVVSPFR